MARIYFLIFWIPAATSAITLWISWSNGMLSHPLRLLTWFLLGLLLQVVGELFSPAWAVGLAVQAILALYLVIRTKLEL